MCLITPYEESNKAPNYSCGIESNMSKALISYKANLTLIRGRISQRIKANLTLVD
jgi:hypothetical protein